METGLKSKIVIITGGAKGIGLATARAFAQQDAKVVIVDKDEAAGQAAEKELCDRNIEVLFVSADLSQPGICSDVIKKTIDRFDRIDVLVNNAGVNDHAGLSATVKEFEKSLRINLVHYFEMVKFAKPHLLKTHGKVVNIGSKIASTGQGGTSGYAAAKVAILGLTREWALELAPSGVTVNAVIPAEVETPMYAQELSRKPDPKVAKENIEKLIPLEGRMTRPEEIASTIIFLSSNLASHITGQFIFVDGGYTHLDRAHNKTPL